MLHRSRSLTEASEAVFQFLAYIRYITYNMRNSGTGTFGTTKQRLLAGKTRKRRKLA
jgi:hypothetical protein